MTPRDLTTCRVRVKPEAMEVARSYGLENEAVSAAVRFPEHVYPDPSSGTRDWYTERRRRGDITVVVTYPDDEPPLVWGVYLNLPMPDNSSTGSIKAGGKGTKLPTSERELRKRIAAHPRLHIVPGTKHDRVVDKTTNQVITTISRGKVGDSHSVANAGQTIIRKGYNI